MNSHVEGGAAALAEEDRMHYAGAAKRNAYAGGSVDVLTAQLQASKLSIGARQRNPRARQEPARWAEVTLPDRILETEWKGSVLELRRNLGRREM